MAAFIWLGIAVVFGIVEAAAPALVCIWFCLGAAVAFITSLFVADVWVQIIVFVVASCLMLLALRPFMRKNAKASPEDAITNYDSYVGREVAVTQAIPAGQGRCGRVLLADVSWLARTANGAPVATGSRVVIKDVDSTVLVVELV